MDLEFLQPLIKQNTTKIILLVMDGLGGLPRETDNKTELEAASTPHLDALAKDSICGLQQPVLPGITPGSGPGHLSLFGYDPIRYQIGRGVLEGLGINFDLTENDLAARGNFCTIDAQGKITDRRAGRISTETNQELCAILREIKIPGVEVFVETVKQHRFLLVLRGANLSSHIADTDPQEIGKAPLSPEATHQDAAESVLLVSQFLDEAHRRLQDQHPANMVTLRGFSKKPNWPSMKEAFGLHCAAIAGYPMYRGVSTLLGMDVLETTADIHQEIDTLEQHWDDYDFFYVHVKQTDSSGEDGDFERKVKVIEDVDTVIPRIRALNPDVIIVSGDHSTPAHLKYHSWHPVPTMLYSQYCRKDTVEQFGERACLQGALGTRFPAMDLLPLALANAKRLEKFGA